MTSLCLFLEDCSVTTPIAELFLQRRSVVVVGIDQREYFRNNGRSATIHDMGLSVTFQRLASESQAASDVTYRESNRPLQASPELFIVERAGRRTSFQDL